MFYFTNTNLITLIELNFLVDILEFKNINQSAPLYLHTYIFTSLALLRVRIRVRHSDSPRSRFACARRIAVVRKERHIMFSHNIQH